VTYQRKENLLGDSYGRVMNKKEQKLKEQMEEIMTEDEAKAIIDRGLLLYADEGCDTIRHRQNELHQAMNAISDIGCGVKLNLPFEVFNTVDDILIREPSKSRRSMTSVEKCLYRRLFFAVEALSTIVSSSEVKE